MARFLLVTFIFIILCSSTINALFLRPLDRHVLRLTHLKELKNCFQEIPSLFFFSFHFRPNFTFLNPGLGVVCRQIAIESEKIKSNSIALSEFWANQIRWFRHRKFKHCMETVQDRLKCYINLVEK